MEQLKALFLTFAVMVFVGVVLLATYYLLILAIPLLIVGTVGFIVYGVMTE